jgi:hypothetical protein
MFSKSERFRRASATLGAGTLLFGLLPAVWPTRFGRWCGLDAAENPTVATAIRSVGARDAVIGLGLLQAARGRDPASLRAWLLARAACDTADTLAVALAVRAGARGRRFLGLGGLALAAAVYGLALVVRARE